VKFQQGLELPRLAVPPEQNPNLFNEFSSLLLNNLKWLASLAKIFYFTL
jgi:hypothetical protein